MEESAVHLKYSGQGFAHDAIALFALAQPIAVLPDLLTAALALSHLSLHTAKTNLHLRSQRWSTWEGFSNSSWAIQRKSSVFLVIKVSPCTNAVPAIIASPKVIRLCCRSNYSLV